LSIKEIIENIKGRLEGNSFGDFSGNFQIIVNTTDYPVYISIIVSEGKLELIQQKIDDADCTIETDENTLSSLLEGKKKPTTAFMMGDLKISGNLDLALKFGRILE